MVSSSLASPLGSWHAVSSLLPSPKKPRNSVRGYESLINYNRSKGLILGVSGQSISRRQTGHEDCGAQSVSASEAVLEETEEVKERRVVVTGLGIVSTLGHDPDVFYDNLLRGASGISKIESFDCSKFPTKIAGEIKSFSVDGLVSRKVAQRADKFMLYMVAAGKRALADGGIMEDTELNKTKCGILIGSALGGISRGFDQVSVNAFEALRVSYKKMHPFSVPFSTTNMGSAVLAIDLGWMGPNYSISTACATSNLCILNSAHHIIRNDVDVMLCGGSDGGVIPLGIHGRLHVLSKRNDEPTKASRPWDIKRDGFVMGEGAGVLLLEELEHAKKRGAKIYAEFLGGSFTIDTNHYNNPSSDGTGIDLCMEKALAQSGVAREDVNHINAHAALMVADDLKEHRAITRFFAHNPELRINSTKSMIGHLMGASGAVEAVATIKAIQTGWIHPNVNLENPDEGVERDILVGEKKERLDIKIAMSNSLAFGGQNSSIIFAPYK